MELSGIACASSILGRLVIGRVAAENSWEKAVTKPEVRRRGKQRVWVALAVEGPNAKKRKKLKRAELR
jgi:hypothetical protein